LRRRWLAAAVAVAACLAGGAPAAADPLDHVSQHELLTVPADWGFLTPEGQITVLSDIIVMMLGAALLLMLALPRAVRRRRGTDEVGRLVPAGGANFVEMVCAYLRDEVARPVLHEHTDRFIKFIWTVFFFILTVNLVGLLPLGSLSATLGTHVGGTATANIWVTAALAVVTLTMMVVNGLRFGGGAYLAHFNPTPRQPRALFWLLSPLIVLVEVIGTLSKIAALAIRLFANMVAGHVLLAVLISFIFSAWAASWMLGTGISLVVVLGAAAITLLEIFVAFLQAFIFTFLTALFLGQSVVFHHGDEAGAH
ncbi:MAG TPA: F0F1 ATP synthase subunit A, partial [Thermoanaerobaculia bacterium]